MSFDIAKYPTLALVDSTQELRLLPKESLPKLCDELRRYLLDSVSRSSGHFASGLGTVELPGITAMGAMGRYVSTPNRDFQPMNCTFGLLDGLLVDKQHKKIRNKQERYTVISERSLSYLRDWVTEMQV